MKTRIVIAGIGGVGGYFGGTLAKHYYGNENIEIAFLARGRHLKKIQSDGLKVIKGDTEFIARPVLATDDPLEIGTADFVIMATKSYDLETVVHQLIPCIKNDTIILPLLNGVDSKERIKSILPDNLVLDGCAYIVSRLKEPGVVENSGNIQKLYFGIDGYINDRLKLFETLLKDAGIEAFLSDNISTTIWEKFIFISPIATATSYFDKSIGELIADRESLETITSLIEEVKSLAIAKQIIVSNDITERTLGKLKALPFGSTTSMHSDFKGNSRQNELTSLTGYVLSEGRKYNLEMPTYLKIYQELKKKTNEKA